VGRLSSRLIRRIILKRGDERSLVRLKDVGHSELGAETYGRTCASMAADAVGIGVIAVPTANRGRVQRCRRGKRAALATFQPGRSIASRSTTSQLVSESIREVWTDAAGSDSRWYPGEFLLCRLAQHRFITTLRFRSR